MSSHKTIQETLVFMPFDLFSLSELKFWISKDSKSEIKAAFGPSVDCFDDIKFPLPSVIGEDPSPNSNSMLITIRTSYHQLINIGYVHLIQRQKNYTNVCYIDCLYISRAFRQKDYEYKILRKIIEFAMNELKCSSCFMWIYATNYLFLSIARILRFHLTGIETDSSGNNSRYCYLVTSPRIDNRIQKKLEKKYAIVIPENPSSPKIPDMSIPNYIYFKKNLMKINGSQKIDKGAFKRKDGVFYSPLLSGEISQVIKEANYMKQLKSKEFPREKGASCSSAQIPFSCRIKDYVHRNLLSERQQYNSIKLL